MSDTWIYGLTNEQIEACREAQPEPSDPIDEILVVLEHWANDVGADADESMAQIQEILTQHGLA